MWDVFIILHFYHFSLSHTFTLQQCTATITPCFRCYHARHLNGNYLRGTIPNSLWDSNQLFSLYVLLSHVNCPRFSRHACMLSCQSSQRQQTQWHHLSRQSRQRVFACSTVRALFACRTDPAIWIRIRLFSRNLMHVGKSVRHLYNQIYRYIYSGMTSTIISGYRSSTRSMY